MIIEVDSGNKRYTLDVSVHKADDYQNQSLLVRTIRAKSVVPNHDLELEYKFSFSNDILLYKIDDANNDLMFDLAQKIKKSYSSLIQSAE
jgi:hypothetical protein